MKKIFLTVSTVLLATLANATAQTSLVSENFSTLADGTAITTTNTSLTYARISSGTSSSLNARNPSTVSTGASALLIATSASLTGIGSTGLAGFSAGSLTFALRTPTTLGTLFLGAGTGGTFTSNSTFSGNDLLAGFQITPAGAFQTRDSTNNWVTLANAPTIAASTTYAIRTLFNGSASTVTYTGGTMAPGTGDVYINGTLVGDDISIRNAVSGSAFRIYTTATSATGATGYEVDDIGVTSLVAVPEPSVCAAIIAGGLGLLASRSRRQR